MSSSKKTRYRYIISYDLSTEKGIPDYSVIESLLKKLGAHRLLQSVWGVRTELELKPLYAQLKRALRGGLKPLDGDGLLVVTVVEGGGIGRGLESKLTSL